MKCPKCGYLGYQDVERCRNCGYEFSLAGPSSPPPSSASVDLRLRETDPGRDPLGDLELIDSRMKVSAQQVDAAIVKEQGNRATAGSTSQSGSTPAEGVELPLFGGPIADDVPLITKASPPRQPLAVRRATPEVPRLRAESRMPSAESPLVTSLAPIVVPKPEPAPATPAPRLKELVPAPAPDDTSSQTASGTKRATAALIDIALMLFVDAIVVYFALKVCRLTVSEIRLLPPVPIAAFLLLQNGGYLVAFTVAGQTLGKMMAGLRVVTLERESSPGVGRAIARAALTLLLALPAGLGLLPVFLSQDGRGLHDRLTGTRVVRVTD